MSFSGRAAAHRAVELVSPGAPQKPLPSDAGDEAIARLDAVRHAKGARKTGEIRLDMQRVMQNNCAVFRTAEVLKEGVEKIDGVADSFAELGITDRSMIWNSDLAEALELENLLEQAVVTLHSAAPPARATGGTGQRHLGPAALLQAYRWIADSRDEATGDRLDGLEDRSGSIAATRS